MKKLILIGLASFVVLFGMGMDSQAADIDCSDISQPTCVAWCEDSSGIPQRATCCGTDVDDFITGTSDADVIVAGKGDDTVDAGGDDDIVCAGKGNDTVYGDAGNDTVSGGQDSDTIYGDAGDDILDGGKGDDTINGGDDDDIIYGGQDDDTLNGEAGDDTIGGGPGSDTVNGGEGDDDACTGGPNPSNPKAKWIPDDDNVNEEDCESSLD